MPMSRKFSRKSTKSNAEALYTRIVRQSRRQEFYADLDVPDTLDGRFDLITLHVFLVLRRLNAEGNSTENLGQALFDVMFMNMDASLREMGVGDLSVGKRIKKMASAFYGRVAAYDAPLLAGDCAGLSDAIARNLFRGEMVRKDVKDGLANYVLATWSHLMSQPCERFRLGLVDFRDMA